MARGGGVNRRARGAITAASAAARALRLGVGAARGANTPGLCSLCLAGSARRTDAGWFRALAAMQEQVYFGSCEAARHRLDAYSRAPSLKPSKFH